MWESITIVCVRCVRYMCALTCVNGSYRLLSVGGSATFGGISACAVSSGASLRSPLLLQCCCRRRSPRPNRWLEVLRVNPKSLA